MNPYFGDRHILDRPSYPEEQPGYLPSRVMPGFSLRAIIAADLLLFTLVALVLFSVIGFEAPQPASAAEGRAATSAPPPVDSLQGYSRTSRFRAIDRADGYQGSSDRDFDDVDRWSTED